MSTDLTPESFLTEKEVAHILRIAASSVRNIRTRGEIGYTRVGRGRGRVLYPKSAVEKFIGRSTRAAAVETTPDEHRAGESSESKN